MVAETPWQAYFWPGTNVLRNRLHEFDPAELQRLEYAFIAKRQDEIDKGAVVIPRTYDSAHLRTIHGHLFQDLYDWAGQYRTVNMEKDFKRFADTHAIEPYLAATHDIVRQTHWNGLERDQFAQSSAQVYAYMNYAHPFREGNGRAAKVFMAHVAEQSRFQLDFDRLADPGRRHEWNGASWESCPRDPRIPPDAAPLTPIFAELAQPRPEHAEATTTDPQMLKAQQLYRSTYGQPVDAAARLAPKRDGAVDPTASHRQHGPSGRDPGGYER